MTVVVDPAARLRVLGGLHDTFIERIAVDPNARTLTIEVVDLNANSVDPPTAPKRPGTLLFTGVAELRLNVDLGEGLRIGQMTISDGPGYRELSLSLSLGGIPSEPATWRVSAKFASLEIIENTQ